jgi:glyoxylase-like metal-dependent hydrolase (beta-lactamase superfamily II)
MAAAHRRIMLKGVLLAAAALTLMGMDAPIEYSIEAIRYGVSPGIPVGALVVDGPKDEKVDVDFVVWLIRGGGRNILFDSGFHRERWFKQWTITDYLRPDEAVRQAGVKPEDVTDVVISHAHWDHMGGIDLFPKATVWIQKDEFRYYTGDAWQSGGQHGGIDPDDVQQLVKLNTEGRLRLVDGDNVEIIPGIRVYVGSRHTYASEYLRVDGKLPYVLASDNVYFYRNLSEHKASATFSEGDHAANIKAQERMIQLAGWFPATTRCNSRNIQRRDGSQRSSSRLSAGYSRR